MKQGHDAYDAFSAYLPTRARVGREPEFPSYASWGRRHFTMTRTIADIVDDLVKLAQSGGEAGERARKAVLILQGNPRTARGDAALVELVEQHGYAPRDLAKDLARYHDAQWKSVDHRLDAPPARYAGTHRWLFWLVLDSRRVPGELGRPIGRRRIEQVLEIKRNSLPAFDFAAPASG